MRNDPILAQTTIEPVPGQYPKFALSFYVNGGLHFLKSNEKPYFTLTYDEFRKGFPDQCNSGGAGHDEILKRFPQFADLAALHLSDIDGVPLYAVENGWYWLGRTEYQARDNKTLAKYLRISEREAARLNPQTKEEFASYVDTLRPRWKAEAVACIAKHNLVLFGDPYPAGLL